MQREIVSSRDIEQGDRAENRPICSPIDHAFTSLLMIEQWDDTTKTNYRTYSLYCQKCGHSGQNINPPKVRTLKHDA